MVLVLLAADVVRSQCTPVAPFPLPHLLLQFFLLRLQAPSARIPLHTLSRSRLHPTCDAFSSHTKPGCALGLMSSTRLEGQLCACARASGKRCRRSDDLKMMFSCPAHGCAYAVACGLTACALFWRRRWTRRRGRFFILDQRVHPFARRTEARCFWGKRSGLRASGEGRRERSSMWGRDASVSFARSMVLCLLDLFTRRIWCRILCLYTFCLV
ncbi:hypothetical protein R3P38DRAFT_3152127 [Favolaschia claudopus]|uniref:Secreted protein n=1 Tax=Favolaschia claudopus TaxID=2862362 RepID=A0AAV9Z0P1_9AGAR